MNVLEEPAALIALAGLNLSLATLVFAVRRTTAHALLGALLAGNAVASVLWAWAAWAGQPPALGIAAFTANSLTLAPLAILPFVVPRRRLSPRAERVALAVAVLVSLASPAIGIASVARGAPVPAVLAHLLNAPWMLLVWVVPSIGTLALLEAYLTAPTRKERSETRLFLFAFVAKCAIVVGGFPLLFSEDLYNGATFDRDAPGFSLYAGAAFASWVAPRVALLAVPIALLASRVSKRAGDRPLSHDVALVLPLGLLLAPPLGLPAIELEFLLLRPLVLTYALVRVRFLGIDGKRVAGHLGTALILTGAALFLVVGGLADEAGLDGRAATAAALVAGVMVPSALAWPALARGLGWSTARAGRREAYRAALEALAAEGRAHEAYDALAPLRRSLGIDDRAHEALAAAVLSTPSAHASGLADGALLAGRYRVLRALGAGSSGEVWLARDERLAREVAVKRLKGDARRDAAALARFEREARLAGAILHPNLVAVHDVEVVGGEAYLVMEHVAGGTLEARLAERGPLPEAEALAMAADVLAGLAALHERGVVHRDVKPANVLFAPEPLAAGGPSGPPEAKGPARRYRAKVGDFTLAHEAVSHETLGVEPAHAGAGTLAFMAPEQARGGRITVASDLYAAGATLYAALAGRPPVAVEGLAEHEARSRVARDAPALPLAGVSERTNAILARALAKAPEERFASAAEMAAAIGARGIEA